MVQNQITCMNHVNIVTQLFIQIEEIFRHSQKHGQYTTKYRVQNINNNINSLNGFTQTTQNIPHITNIKPE